MNGLKLSRYAASACVATLLLAGCGGMRPPISTPSAMHGTQPLSAGTNPSTLGAAGKRPLYGGAAGKRPLYGGAFSAHYKITSSRSCGYQCTFTKGLGWAKFLGRSRRHVWCFKTGCTAKLSNRRKGTSITAGFYFGAGEHYEITGGTGEFAHASGFGTITYKFNSGSTYIEIWSGTLYY